MPNDQSQRTAERVAIAMAYNGKQRGWAPDMTDYGKRWWLTKAAIGLNEVRRIVQATRERANAK